LTAGGRRGTSVGMDFLLNALVTLFVTIDPVGLAPVFVVVTLGQGPAQRQRTAIRATAVAAVVLVGFALVGERLIGALGISLPAFKIAGGLLLFHIAFEMVFGRREGRKTASAEAGADDHEAHDVAVFPLAIPLTAGPGAISAAILLASRAAGPAALAGLIAIIVAIVGLCLLIFLQAGRIERALGVTGRIVVSRLLGVLLAALSVQFVTDGLVALLPGLAG
jgi:multiple antibiotic resistance protein